jgi:hypothetical protein
VSAIETVIVSAIGGLEKEGDLFPPRRKDSLAEGGRHLRLESRLLAFNPLRPLPPLASLASLLPLYPTAPPTRGPTPLSVPCAHPRPPANPLSTSHS